MHFCLLALHGRFGMLCVDTRSQGKHFVDITYGTSSCGVFLVSILVLPPANSLYVACVCVFVSVEWRHCRHMQCVIAMTTTDWSKLNTCHAHRLRGLRLLWPGTRAADQSSQSGKVLSAQNPSSSVVFTFTDPAAGCSRIPATVKNARKAQGVGTAMRLDRDCQVHHATCTVTQFFFLLYNPDFRS